MAIIFKSELVERISVKTYLDMGIIITFCRCLPFCYCWLWVSGILCYLLGASVFMLLLIVGEGS